VTVSGIPRPATSATAVLEHVRPGSDLIVQSANGEPVTVLDAIEAAAAELERISVHQGLPVRDRPYHAGAFGDRLRGRTIRQRALALIAIAAPPFRDDLRAAARDLAYL
jgi:hypothetical protein